MVLCGIFQVNYRTNPRIHPFMNILWHYFTEGVVFILCYQRKEIFYYHCAQI
jgi:hypothetical protein